EDALPVAELSGLCRDLVGFALDEELREDMRRRPLGRNQRSAARPRQAEALASEAKTRESRLRADAFGRELVERDRVAEPDPARRVRGRGEEAENGIVTVVDVRVRQAGHDREVVAEVLHHFEIRSECIVLAGLLREE